MYRIVYAGIGLFFFAVSIGAGQTVSLQFDPSVPQIAFAVEKIQHALDAKAYNSVKEEGQFRIIIAVKPAGDKPESFSISKGLNGQISVIGVDPAGAMYGGLELAEMIHIGGLEGVEKTSQSPYMAMRGTKFNCPLDVRSPSYTDVCDSAQQNIGEMWSFEFWKEYIDTLAMYRYNYISLWNLHPFPSMVKVWEYPDVALADVKRSTVNWQEYYPRSGEGFTAPEIVNNTETLKKMTNG